MNIKIKKNLCSGILTSLFGIVFLFLIPLQIKSKIITDTSALGPDYMPRLVGWLLIMLGLGLIFQSLVLKKDTIETINLKDELNVLIYVGIFLVYLIILYIIGFLLSTIIFSFALLFIMKAEKKSYYFAAVVLSVFIYCLFKYVLKVPLP